MPVILETRKDPIWAPPGSELVVVKDKQIPPLELVVTVHVLCFKADRILMVLHQDRGWDVPGGHVEPGETLEAALVRETYEESGASICNITPVGHIKLTLTGPRPDGWKYPYPEGYLLFYYAEFEKFYNIALDHETTDRRLFTPKEAATISWIKEWRCLYQLGIETKSKGRR